MGITPEILWNFYFTEVLANLQGYFGIIGKI